MSEEKPSDKEQKVISDVVNDLNWLERHKFLAVAVIMIVIWSSLLAFWYFKAEEITKDPCSICSKRMGKEVVCSPKVTTTENLVFYPNGSIKHNLDESLQRLQPVTK